MESPPNNGSQRLCRYVHPVEYGIRIHPFPVPGTNESIYLHYPSKEIYHHIKRIFEDNPRARPRFKEYKMMLDATDRQVFLVYLDTGKEIKPVSVVRVDEAKDHKGNSSREGLYFLLVRMSGEKRKDKRMYQLVVDACISYCLKFPEVKNVLPKKDESSPRTEDIPD